MKCHDKMDKIRAEFEEWAAFNGIQLDRSHPPYWDGYISQRANDAWLAWFDSRRCGYHDGVAAGRRGQFIGGVLVGAIAATLFIVGSLELMEWVAK